MSGKKQESRLSKLQGLKKQRGQQADVDAAGAKDGEKGKGGGLLRGLMKNPNIQNMVSGFLAQQGNRGNDGLGTQALGDALGPEDFGMEKLGQEERISTSSTQEEIERYRRQLSNRADWLEAALEETLLELERTATFVAAAPKPKVKKKASSKKKAPRTSSVKKSSVQKAAPKKKVSKTSTAKKTVKKSSVKKVVKKKAVKKS